MTKRQSKPETAYQHTINEAAKAYLDKALLHIPGVKAGKAFGHPAYKINGRIFALAGERGIVLKLPEARVRELVASSAALLPFGPAAGIVWREWLLVAPENEALFQHYAQLLDEAIQFVAGTTR